MKLPVIKRLDKQDLVGRGEIPGWLDPFISVLNSFIEPVGKALQSRLTFGDNFLCTVQTINLTHATEQIVGVNSSYKVIGALPLLAINSTDKTATGNIISGFGVNKKSSGLGVTVNFAGGSGVKADVTLILLYG